jgi:putative nucleotidyltransferase with HDIG domain
MELGTTPARCWPYMLVATALVTAVPAYIGSLLAPSGSMMGLLGALAVALALSIAMAKAGAALWMRHPLARDVLFADLMAWEWLRRFWVERRVARAQTLLTADDPAPHTRAEALARLARLLEARDAYTHGHSQRVARHAVRIARALHLPAADTARIATAATLHDVGKVYTPREILNKPDRLSDAEFDVIKRHPIDGAEMLTAIGDPELVAIVRSHHERLDGAGYPDGLAGDDIPLGARIIAVADTFDALTSTRSYRSAASHKRALDILRKEAGAQLDRAAVGAFLQTYSGRRPVAWSALAAFGPQKLISWLGREATTVASLTPATGWVAPAAAALALLGTSVHLTDRAPARSSQGTTASAEVRSARAAAVVTPRERAAVRRAPREPQGTTPGVQGRRRAPSRRPARAPASNPTPASTTASLGTATQSTPDQPSVEPTKAAPTTDSISIPTPAVSTPSTPDTTPVRQIVASATLPTPRPVVAPVVEGVEDVVSAVTSLVPPR